MNNKLIREQRVVLYLRLSKEDMDKATKDTISESIKNQEKMLREEVKKHINWKIVGVYADEDFSGAGTYRPEFEKMILACKNKLVDIVLCKSQSRFSRDMEVIERYLHNKFKEWKIRFISLVDNADTSVKGNKKARQINALVNEWFLEDLSDNIKATFRAKWKAGECTSAFSKYGLMKDPKNKNHLLIDPIASEVVKLIGTLYLRGYGQDKIAKILEQQEIPSPYEYKLLNGSKLKLPNVSEENKVIIEKVGKYVIKIFLYNNYGEILNNIRGFFLLDSDIIKQNEDKFIIKIKEIGDDLELYSPTFNLDYNMDIKSLDWEKGNWKKLQENDYIPKNIYSILFRCKRLDRLNTIICQLELELVKNKQHKTYNLLTKQIADNKNINFFLQYEIRKKYRWYGQIIYNMLRDPIYNGILIQGRTKRISYKNHKCVNTIKDEWVVKENALEKIFDDRTWNLIQNKLKEGNRSTALGYKHIFSGKVYCKVCGSKLNINTSSNKNKKIRYLLCSDKKNKWINCNNDRAIRFEELEKIIINSFNELLDKYYDSNILNSMYKKILDEIYVKKQRTYFDIEKMKILKLLEEKEKVLKNLYNDLVLGIIDDDDFKVLKAKYKDDVSLLNKRLLIINDNIREFNIKSNSFKEDNTLIQKYKKINELTPELINIFIDKIKIDKLQDNKTRDIIINWNF